MPELPTVAESGVPGYSYELWWGIFAPAGMPAERLNFINASINNDIVRTKVPEPWKPDPQKIDTADPTALEADWEAEVDSMQEWDPTIGEDPTQSGDPGRLA